jgi:hypothetical protein
VKTEGTIIENKEQQRWRDQLGGNINSPTIKFYTLDGQEIIGEPVTSFVSQFEVEVPSSINIIYNSKNPHQFYIDGV